MSYTTPVFRFSRAHRYSSAGMMMELGPERDVMPTGTATPQSVDILGGLAILAGMAAGPLLAPVLAPTASAATSFLGSIASGGVGSAILPAALGAIGLGGAAPVVSSLLSSVSPSLVSASEQRPSNPISTLSTPSQPRPASGLEASMMTTTTPPRVSRYRPSMRRAARRRRR